MNVNPHDQIKYLKGSIKEKRKSINNLLKIIGVIVGFSVLAGTGIGLIFSTVVKGIALGIASGAVLSINPVMKISDLVSAIDVDQREIATLNYRIKKENNDANSALTQVKQPEREQEKTVTRDNLSDSDMDKMIDLFEKSKYDFKHKPIEMPKVNDLIDDEQRKHR